MTIIKKEQHQHEIKLNSSSNPETVRYDTNLCRNRCIICYKLLKNWKGATLTPHYDIDKLIGVSSKTSLSLNSIEEHADETESEDNGDALNNKNNSDQTLVNNGNSNSNTKSNCGETTRAKKSTIGELIQKSLVVSSKEKSSSKQATPANALNYLQQILKANSEIGKKLCKTCHDYIVLIDYHMNLADNLRSLMKNKLLKSFQLINTNRLIKNSANGGSSQLDLNRIKLFSLNSRIKKRKLRLVKAKRLTRLGLSLHNGVYLANGSTSRSVLGKANSLVTLRALEASVHSGSGLKRKVNEPAISKTSGNLVGEDYGELVNEIKIARLAKQESSKNGRVVSSSIGPKLNQNSTNSNGWVNSSDTNQHQSPFKSSSNAAHVHQNRNITSVSRNQIQVGFELFVEFLILFLVNLEFFVFKE